VVSMICSSLFSQCFIQALRIRVRAFCKRELHKRELYKRELYHLPLRIGGSPCQIFGFRVVADSGAVALCLEGNYVVWPAWALRSDRPPKLAPTGGIRAV